VNIHKARGIHAKGKGNCKKKKYTQEKSRQTSTKQPGEWRTHAKKQNLAKKPITKTAQRIKIQKPNKKR